MNLKSICVFCGSNVGTDPAYVTKAVELGHFMAENGIHLVYGGGKVGLMGTIANAVLEKGGTVTGVIPDFLRRKEVAHEEVTELIEVKSMHERKMLMADKSDAFIAMPGGIGTLEELAEIFTWSVLSLHKKPVGLLNVNGYYDHLVGFFDQMVGHKFLHPENRKIVVEADEPKALMDLMKKYDSPGGEKWLDKSLL